MRKFEFVKRLENTDGLKLPERSTKNSGGYDIYAIEDFEIQPYEIKYVPVGIKVQMESDEVLILANRSSNPRKKAVVLSSGINIIDADYYNNPDNEGELSIILTGIGDEPSTFKKGDKICQGVFMKYLVTDDDSADGVRCGGFGSTGK